MAHITGVQHRHAAVHGYEIREALTVDAVVQHKNTVAGLRQRSAGGFQSQDSFAAENQRFILRVQKPADQPAGITVFICKCFIQIRVAAGKTAGDPAAGSGTCVGPGVMILVIN